MDSVILVAILILLRYGISRISADTNYLRQSQKKLFVVLATILVGASPLILLRFGALADSWINVLIAGIAMLYFAIFLSRQLRRLDEEEVISQ